MFELVLFVFLLLKTLGCKTGTTPKYNFSAKWNLEKLPRIYPKKMGIFWSGEPAKSHPKFLKWIAGHRPPAESDSPYKGACAAARHFWGRLRAAVIHRSLCVLCVFFLCKTHHKCLESCFHIAAWSYIINDINVFCFFVFKMEVCPTTSFLKKADQNARNVRHGSLRTKTDDFGGLVGHPRWTRHVSPKPAVPNCTNSAPKKGRQLRWLRCFKKGS